MNREELIDVITKEIEKLNTLPNIKEENFNIGYKKAIYDSCYLYENMNQEIERLNNKINSIFSNFEQFINSYKNDTIDDFFIVLRLSEVVEFYNDLKEVISDD